MKDKKNKEQPRPKAGYTFTGWAIFNWGFSSNIVFRTRKNAIEYCVENMSTKEGQTWKDIGKYCRVVKVRCSVI